VSHRFDLLAQGVHDFVQKATDGIRTRVLALEQRAATADADAQRIKSLEETVVSLRAELAEVRSQQPDIDGSVRRYFEQHPVEVRHGEKGQDGASVTLEDVAPLVEFTVAKAVAALPKAQDGKDGTPGKDGQDGKDAVGVADVLIARDGTLVATFTDGRTKNVGMVVGAKGEPGQDGLGFDDFEEEQENERTIVRRYRNGDRVKEFRHTFPMVIDRGVYAEGKGYQRGDGVTYGGSFFIAQVDQPVGKPEDGSKDWRLSVKRGRDGKPGVNGKDGAPGLDGRPGRDWR
jgi:hypothetical protein